MNDESKQLLTQLVELQKEQTELLRKYLPPLWTRIRFSLLALLLLMTRSWPSDLALRLLPLDPSNHR
jgi:hypothetical protein